MSEGLYRLPDTEIWSHGEPRGKLYKPSDLSDMEKNFHAFSSGPNPYLAVSFVPGHEEEMDRTDLIAGGWVEGIGKGKDGILRADIEGVPRPLARIIKRKGFKTVSPEIYDAPPDGIPRAAVMAELKRRGKDPDALLAEAKRYAEADRKEWPDANPPSVDWFADCRLRAPLGKMLRRVCALGGEVPQNKMLANLPDPEEYSEGPARPKALKFSEVRRSAAGAYYVFSEVTKMADGDMAMMSEEEEDKKYEGDHSALPPEEVEKMREKAKSGFLKYASRCRKMGESDEALQTYLAETPMPEKKKDEPMDDAAKFSEQFKPLVAAAVKAAVDQVRAEFAPIQKDVADFKANTTRASVEKFCETMLQAGKIIPAQLEKVQARLLRADAREKVHKFSENGKDGARTELEEQMAEIERGPVLLRFGERPVKVSGDANADDGKAAVEAHYESFAETYKAMGTTKEELTKAFEAARKESPRLTVEQFLKPAAAAV